MAGSLKKQWIKGFTEVGCDEAGRGCLAGPVVAAAVILDPKKTIRGLNDSKKLSAFQRDKLREEIEQKSLAFGIGQCSPQEIDQWNILRCSFIAMHRALDQIQVPFQQILVDGNRFNPYKDIPFECIVKGDARSQSIAAASILAKTYRDETMEKLHEKFPMYLWNENKGYPTNVHRAAIKMHGACEAHRHTFNLLPAEQLKLRL